MIADEHLVAGTERERTRNQVDGVGGVGHEQQLVFRDVQGRGQRRAGDEQRGQRSPEEYGDPRQGPYFVTRPAIGTWQTSSTGGGC